MAPTLDLPASRISLSEKQLPTEELTPAQQTQLKSLAKVYGPVNCQNILKRLEEEEPGIWEQSDNVCFERAFHDRIGVRQIIFTFCDDLLETVYRLPWWYKWKAELQEVFDCIGIKPENVIRCLFAKMEPGMKIPVHHDTGLWSTRSHRVHVPLLTSNQDGNEREEVVVRVGLEDSGMQRFQFNAGVATELNNRAKHEVENNWSEGRVHLIFDYVNDPQDLTFQDLTTDHFVEQTRRAIIVHGRRSEGNFKLKYPHQERDVGIPLDSELRQVQTKELLSLVKAEGSVTVLEFLAICKRYATGEMLALDYLQFLKISVGENINKSLDIILNLITDVERKDALKSLVQPNQRLQSLPRVPRFLIIGVMKCGTTSLYDYINQHPDVCAANGKEPHFFDWKWDAVCSLTVTKEMSRRASILFERPKPNNLQLKYTLPFNVKELTENKRLVTGEATPSYILGGSRVAHRIHAAVSSNVRLLVILRNPVRRAYSHYQMTKDPTGTAEQKKRRGCVHGKSFAELIDEDLEKLEKAGVEPEMNPKVFEDEYLVNLPSGHGSHSYVGRGLYALQLRRWFTVFPRECFHFMLLEDLADQTSAQHEMDKVFDFLDLDPHKLNAFPAKNSRSYDSMDSVMQRKLEEFYEPFNKNLEQLLGIDLSKWRNQ